MQQNEDDYNEDIKYCENSTCGAQLEEGRIGYCDECIDVGYGDDEYLGDDRIFSGFWDEYEPAEDYGGAFDGFTVTSDADSGL